MSKRDVALIYDFDGTLAKGNIQDYDFIPALDMTSTDFWNEVDTFKKNNNMESILAYMYLMIEKAEEKNISVKRSSFVKYGKNVQLFNGVEDWFHNINEYAKSLDIVVHHFVISSGIKEMIEGTKIKDEFEKIYACSFLYSIDEIALWPSVSINYTNKTQFLFRINKGIYEIYDDSVNVKMKKEDKPIDFKNMIYIGDGLTDVPSMILVKDYDGLSIAVYDSENKRKVTDKLVEDNRANYSTAADYSVGKDLDLCVRNRLLKIANEGKICK